MKTKMKIALTAAAMISGTATMTTTHAADEAMGKCHGVNACKGKTACATAEGACAGNNSCKGKGWLPMSEADCAEKDGQFEAFSKTS